jgi:hypothetical protein
MTSYASIDERTVWSAARELDRLRTRAEAGWAGLTLSSVLSIVGIPVLLFAGGGAGAIISVGLFGLWTGTAIHVFRTGRESRRVESYLCAADDLEAIGPLIDSLSSSGFGGSEALRRSLEDLLLSVNIDNTPSLTVEQRRALRLIPLYIDDTELAVAALQAMKYTGDRRDRTMVLMLAEGLQTETRSWRIQRAARECLRAIDPNYDGPLEADLLRPAGSPPDTLLRPSRQHHDRDESLLLRVGYLDFEI